MRVLPWPLPRALGYTDQQVVMQLDERDMRMNTTKRLRDLLKEEIDLHEAVMSGGHFERSGESNALGDKARLDQTKVNLRLVKANFVEGSVEVNPVRERAEALERKFACGR
jgi:hypothetical protein